MTMLPSRWESRCSIRWCRIRQWTGTDSACAIGRNDADDGAAGDRRLGRAECRRCFAGLLGVISGPHACGSSTACANTTRPAILPASAGSSSIPPSLWAFWFVADLELPSLRCPFAAASSTPLARQVFVERMCQGFPTGYVRVFRYHCDPSCVKVAYEHGRIEKCFHPTVSPIVRALDAQP